MAYTHLFLGTLLVPLMGLDGVQGPCPAFCRCQLEILNCSRITSTPGIHQIPLPKLAVHPHPFRYLDFTGNVISSIRKEVWNAYPWAEYLVLKDNSLSRLQSSSLEGLLSLAYLDLSCNKIQIIERNAFEAAPFLQIINLSDNTIERIPEGTFQAWHGMQFLLKVDLSHNPLAVIQDSSFYRLPSLKLLDLGATEVTPRMLEGLLKLRVLISPKEMSCCLCHIKENIEVLCETFQLECTESCAIPEEPLNSMQGEVLKTLETRKLNGGSPFTTLPERARPNNDLQDSAGPNSDKLLLAQIYSSFAANFNLLKPIKQVMQMKGDEPLDMNWAGKSLLKQLYLLPSLLEGGLRENMMELGKDTPEATIHNELSPHGLEKSTDEATKISLDTSLKKERHVRNVLRGNWLRIQQRRDRREFAEATTQSADQPNVFESRNVAESQRKSVEVPDPWHALSFFMPHQAGLQSSRKRSISDSPTSALHPTVSIRVDKNNNLTNLSSDGNSVAVLRNRHAEQILTKEELLNKLLHRSNPPARHGKSKIPAINSTLKELLPDIMLSRRTYWEHQRTSVSPTWNLAPQDDYSLQSDLFEAELNKQITSLIPNTLARKLISHVIRILKMDCTAPQLQMACAKLISRTSLLMKLFSENINETSSLWKSYFWPPKNVTNMTEASSRKLEKSSDRTESQRIPAYEYGNKLLLAISVTAIVMVVVIICLIVICSQHSAIKYRTFLGRRRKTLLDEEHPRTRSLFEPLWLKDMYYIQDEIQRNNIVGKSHDKESLEAMEMVGWCNARSSIPEPNTEKPSSVPTLELLIPPVPPTPSPLPAPLPPAPPSSPPSQKSSVKKGSDKAEGTSESTSSKAASSAADEGEDKESSAERSENPTTTEATSEAPESG